MPEIDNDDDDDFDNDDYDVFSSYRRISNTIGTGGGPVNYNDDDDDNDDGGDDEVWSPGTQWHRTTQPHLHGHDDSMTELAQRGRFSEKPIIVLNVYDIEVIFCFI